MNNIVIPTPVESQFTEKKVRFPGFTIENESLAAPYALKMGRALLKENGRAKLVLSKLDHENDQAYHIKIEAETVSVSGAGKIAFIYAMSTLSQLADFEVDEIILPEGEVFDYPNFPIRGVNWLLFVDVRGWSHDDGDGMDSFVKRFIDGLDTLAFLKLNAAFIDGFGWNPERFPGYGKLMRTLNREARERGIRLIFGGYSAGYGAQWYDFDGPTFKNRESYPDGPVYSCLSHPASKEAGTMGTCLGNEALMEEKKRNLRDFVNNVEPGMLHIHGVDICSQRHAVQSWSDRCPVCRERWPNDDVNAPDGMAGAFAHFYDELFDAVQSVKNPDSGYDASRDCVVDMASPNYTQYVENDEEWAYHLDYFKILTRCMRNKNIHLVLREQFFNQAEGESRLKQFREVVGNSNAFTVIYFASGSGFYNNLPVTADAACVKYFDGMNAVIAGSGNAFQEPRQAIHAEYMWNPKGSAFKVGLPTIASNDEFLTRYHDLTHGRETPEAIFGKNGLLEVVCAKLYGKEAGELVTEAQRPTPLPASLADGVPPPNPQRGFNALAPLAPLHTDTLPGYQFSIFLRNWKGQDVFWRDNLTENEIEYAKRGIELLTALSRLSEEAAALYEKAASRCDPKPPLVPEMRERHLTRMSRTCATGVELANFVSRWLSVFSRAHQTMREGADCEKLSVEIKRLREDLKEFRTRTLAHNDKPIDPYKGDLTQAVKTADFLSMDLDNIAHTLESGEYREMKKDAWW